MALQVFADAAASSRRFSYRPRRKTPVQGGSEIVDLDSERLDPPDASIAAPCLNRSVK